MVLVKILEWFYKAARTLARPFIAHKRNIEKSGKKVEEKLFLFEVY